MTPHYTEMYRFLRQADRFEKYASEAPAAQLDLASVCSGVFDEFMKRASSSYGPAGTPVDAARVAGMLGTALYDTARAGGEKVAAEDVATTYVEHLAAAAYVDATIKTACEKLAGNELVEAQRVQLLGREYAVDLLRSLVG